MKNTTQEASVYPPMRMTIKRKVILEVLGNSRSHLTADELFEKVRKCIPRISLGTVYRNLEMLTQNGLVNVLEGGTQRRYDAIRDFHYHIRCIKCGRVDDAPVETVSQLEETLQKRTLYVVLGHRLEFMGICPHCKKEDT